MKNDGGPAFPGFHIDNGVTTIYGGMSLRDYFANCADQNAYYQFHYGSDPISSVAWKWRYADAMLAERDKP